MSEKPTSSETPSERRFKWLSAVWIPLIAVALTVPITLWITAYSGRIRQLKYAVDSKPALFKYPNLKGTQFKIVAIPDASNGNSATPTPSTSPTIKDARASDSLFQKEFNNISALTIYLYNDSDQDFEDLIYDITFKPPTGSQKMPELFKVSTPPQPSDAFNLTQTSNSDESLLYTLKLPVLNRSQKPLAKLDFTFIGEINPDVNVNVRKKGVEAVYYNPIEAQKASSYPPIVLWLEIVIVVVSFSTVYITVHYNNVRKELNDLKSNGNYLKYLEAELAQRNIKLIKGNS